MHMQMHKTEQCLPSNSRWMRIIISYRYGNAQKNYECPPGHAVEEGDLSLSLIGLFLGFKESSQNFFKLSYCCTVAPQRYNRPSIPDPTPPNSKQCLARVIQVYPSACQQRCQPELKHAPI